MIDHEALGLGPDASAQQRSSATDVIQPGELEVYRADLEEWFRQGTPHLPTGVRPGTLDELITAPSPATKRIPAFFQWMRETRRGPWAPPPGVVVTVAGGFHVGDRVRGGSGQESTVIPAPPGRLVEGVWTDTFDTPTWAHPSYFTLVSCPHEVTEEGLAAAREAAGITAPEGYIPWGPGHPDWESFWTKADEAARRAGYCDEYNRLAGELGRTSPDEVVTYDITVQVKAKVPAGTQLSTGQMFGILTHRDADLRRTQDHIEHLGSDTLGAAEVHREPYRG